MKSIAQRYYFRIVLEAHIYSCHLYARGVPGEYIHSEGVGVKQTKLHIQLLSSGSDTTKLYIVNEKLWEYEDAIRECERQKKFDKGFINLARAIYITNDERAKIKLEINKKFGSQIIEVKSYKKY